VEVILNDKIGGGTCFQGCVNTTYAKLVEVFGEPNCNNDGYKVDAEWGGTIDGHEFTIYNYKDGKNYNGDDGLVVDEITDWHIGGREKDVADLINKYIFS